MENDKRCKILEARFKAKKLVVMEVGATVEIARAWDCNQDTVRRALAFRSHTKLAVDIRRYAIENYTVYYRFSRGLRIFEYPAVPLCQDCQNHVATTKGDYCEIKEAYVRRRLKKCFYKETADGTNSGRTQRKTLKVIEYPKIYEQIASGCQTEVYKPRTPYWSRMLFAQNYIVYDRVEIRTTGKNSEVLTFEVTDITVGFGNKDWSCPQGEPVYIIKLGRRMEQ